MTLWTPANLIITPKLILDPSTASWSGSNWGSTTNTGSWGGNIISSTGVPVKGTQLNGFDVVSFNGSVSLQTSISPVWPASTDIFIFAIVSMSASQAMIAQGWDTATATTGWVLYPRYFTTGSINGLGATATDDFFSFAQGFGSGTVPGAMIAHSPQPFADGAYHTMTWNSCSTQLMDVDGNVETTSNATGTCPTLTTAVFIGESHGGGSFSEPYTGTVAYLLIIAGNPTQSDYQKLEGWAAWKYGLTTNLPGGHPYKSAAPVLPGGLNMQPQQVVFA